MPGKNFLRDRLRSFVFAGRGIWLLLRTEGNFQVHFSALVFILIAGYFFGLTGTEWCLQLLAAALVFGMEIFNTAIEKLCDFVHPDREDRIGVIKDISAAAVLWSAITAVVIAAIIYVPKIQEAL